MSSRSEDASTTGSPEDEFAEFVAARAPALMRTAYVLTGHAQDAEDLLQTALLKAAGQWKRIRHSPEPYLRRVLYHESVSGWRFRKRRPPEDLVHSPPESASPASGDADIAITLERALARLTPKQRAVLVLRFYEDLTEQQTAAALGVGLGTVKSQTRHALMRLRELSPELTDLAPRSA